MDVTLLVSKQVCRKVFQKEDYVGEDDIFALVISGSFQFDKGSGMQTVGLLEGVNFQRGIRYHRQITQEAQIYLFRYRSREDIFGSGTVVFQDTARVRRTGRPADSAVNITSVISSASTAIFPQPNTAI